MLKKKIWASFQRIILLSPKKLSLSSQNYGFGIRDPEKTYPGSRIQGSKKQRIPDPDPQHWVKPCSSARKASLCAPSIDTSVHFQIKTFPTLSELLGVGEMFLVFGGVAFLCLLWGVSTEY
jgi:hypothetical protein